MLDVSTNVREGEELDIVSLGVYLRSRLPTPFDKVVVEQYPEGNSNLTYLIRLGERSFVLRRPPFGNTVKSAHDMKREYWVLKKLSKLYPLAPEPFLFCEDTSVIGAEFYLMERRRGVILRGEVPQELAGSRELQEKVLRSFIRNLIRLHRVDLKAAILSELGNPEGYNQRQVEGWTKRYITAKTEEHLELEEAIKWLNANVPAESGASLIHNDYKFDNIMLSSDDLTRVVAVLDWEMVTVGDPLMDLGTTLGYWMSPEFGEEMMNMPFNPRVLMENFSRRDLADMYAEASDHELPDLLFYYVFGTFKISVIAQQIYARYSKGLTKDPRFANFDRFVGDLGRIAAKSIDKGRI
ncbi:MAG TPA: phosphotransferase family protein [Pyrinomonadaceae bacterium]|nr:phosphotransferase family protein [Pyrinomonadaceae bacterium]HMP65890.1 phosphotransferase family protein [Pyrinomonadaceae bacterium]